MKRGFTIDIETGHACGGTMKGIACLDAPVVIEKMLTPLGKKDTAKEAARLPEGQAAPVSLFD